LLYNLAVERSIHDVFPSFIKSISKVPDIFVHFNLTDSLSVFFM